MLSIASLGVHSVLADTIGPFYGHITPDGNGVKKPIGGSALSSATSAWTMNFWVRPDGPLADETLLAGFGDGKNGRGQERFLASFADGLRFWGGSVDVKANVSLEPQKWQMVSAVYKDGVIKIYKDGAERASQAVNLAQVAPSVILGPKSPWPTNNHFFGKIADFTLQDRALSPDEILGLSTAKPDWDALTFESDWPESWKPQQGGGRDGDPKQDPNSFPHSKAPRAEIKPTLPAIVSPRKQLAPDANGDVMIRGIWKLAEAPRVPETGEVLSRPEYVAKAGTSPWYSATVPGTVLTTLVNQGVYPDPLHGLNNLEIPESLSKQDYWYRAEFVAARQFTGRTNTLTFNGINYRAEVWLNGTRLGGIAGAFTRGVFDVSKVLKPGVANVLAVRVSPVPQPGIAHEESLTAGAGPNGGSMVGDGPTFFCSEGWDWIPGIRDRNTGLWQDVMLHSSDTVSFGDAQVVTHLAKPIGAKANVNISAELKNNSSAAQTGTLRGEFEGVAFEKKVTLPAGTTQTVMCAPSEFAQLSVANPRLWWPNGYGKPELYHLRLTFRNSAGKVSDIKQVRFGMREVSVELTAFDASGKIGRYEYFPATAGKAQIIDNTHHGIVNTRLGWMPSVVAGGEKSPALVPSDDTGTGVFLVVKVNGQRIALKGGNWGMDEAMKRVSRERLEPFIRLQHDSHFTTIRNWCGQSTSETFYDLCDEYGMLVWDEFWLTTQNYNQEPRNSGLLLGNAKDSIKRFRNHPSIILWCGRNEGVPPPVINEGLDKLIREFDGTRYYQPNSRIINLLSSGPWNYQNPSNYFTNFKGFTTELGLPNPPSADTMRAMMPQADLWPISDNWAYHDWHQTGAGNVKPFMDAMHNQFGDPVDLDDFSRKAQMINYVEHRAMFEGFNASLWQPNSGRLLWMSHPSWPSLSWQLYSSNYETGGAYFGIQKACEPVHIQLNLNDGTVGVVNNTLLPLRGVRVNMRVYNLDGTQASSEDGTLDVAVDSVARSFVVKAGNSPVYFVKLILRDASGKILSENFYWQAAQESGYQALNQLPKVQLALKAAVRRDAQKIAVTVDVENPSQSVALMSEFVLRNAKTHERILPVYASENYLSLLPGEKREITLEVPVSAVPDALNVTTGGWNVQPTQLPLK